MQGAAGKMGHTLIETILDNPNCQLAGAFDLPTSVAIGQDAGAFLGKSTGIIITDNIEQAIEKSDVLIDFTRPEGTMTHVSLCLKHNIKLVIGTTGFSESQKQTLLDASQKIAIVQSPNMSVGVNATYKLLEVASKILKGHYDIEIIEAHHRHKVDAPSGTALRMGEVIAKAKGWDFDQTAILSREGHTGPRPSEGIGFATVRGGDIIGDHTVMFAGTGERIEISHFSSSRSSYASGALLAAEFLATKTQGFYDMQDVLAIQLTKARGQAKSGLTSFWASPNLEDAAQTLQAQNNALIGHFAQTVVETRDDRSKHLDGQADMSARLTKNLRATLQAATHQLETGQVVLATIGSTAPFVGLFGTVWGIFHALTKIANTGSVAIDQIAGPVGEALIMTAFGLVVAVPAVIAYNFFGRFIRTINKILEAFAADLLHYFGKN
ncbi:unnamed protein product [Darwinula stevensoni]|uniref:4-hydroxy-tetrahydrodipicolinate reductase n=1 Tax=Darwinula stevensoni TaxID=69355 RepID=A0A7R9FTE1_9CRUS|nr:unnamed protein product [Darwinula stevensoni]CAG0905815.1 unnamed protein product [Darwinula stevensoni]